MNVNRQTKQSRTFRLSNYTISRLKRLSMKFSTSMTQIVEIAVSQFIGGDEAQKYLTETINNKKEVDYEKFRENRGER